MFTRCIWRLEIRGCPGTGYLDDIVIVPAGIALAVTLVPPELMAEFRATAASREGLQSSGCGSTG
jgi:hypothetical protein